MLMEQEMVPRMSKASYLSQSNNKTPRLSMSSWVTVVLAKEQVVRTSNDRILRIEGGAAVLI
jgi:hypothetical protein